MLALIARAMPRASQQRSVPQCVLIVLRYIKAHAEKSIVTNEFREPAAAQTGRVAV
jgi:hypothetical protein